VEENQTIQEIERLEKEKENLEKKLQQLKVKEKEDPRPKEKKMKDPYRYAKALNWRFGKLNVHENKQYPVEEEYFSLRYFVYRKWHKLDINEIIGFSIIIEIFVGFCLIILFLFAEETPTLFIFFCGFIFISFPLGILISYYAPKRKYFTQKELDEIYLEYKNAQLLM
jgi:hypothetical protein